MNNILLALVLLFAGQVYAQNPAPKKLIKVTFQNNSPGIYKLALLAFRPGEDQNETRISNMLPFTKKQYTFPEGTSVYIANTEQVNYTMSGKSVYQRGDKPDVLVTAANADKIYKLIK